jgi:hypothetical protein
LKLQDTKRWRPARGLLVACHLSASVLCLPGLNVLASRAGGLLIPEVNAEGLGCNPQSGSEGLTMWGGGVLGAWLHPFKQKPQAWAITCHGSFFLQDLSKPSLQTLMREASGA